MTTTSNPTSKVVKQERPQNFDWRGTLKERFWWSKFRREFGWWYFKTDCMGITTESRWEWEKP